MKPSSVTFLKAVILLFGLAVATLCVFLTMSLVTQPVGTYHPLVIVMLIAAFPFFIGEYHTFKLLNNVTHRQAFSHRSIKSLNIIKLAGLCISSIYGLGLPYIYYLAQQDDAPGIMLLGLIFTGAPLMAAICAGLLQKIFQDALALQQDNELAI